MQSPSPLGEQYRIIAYKCGATEVVHDRASVKRLTSGLCGTVRGSFTLSLFRKLMNGCISLRILLICIMCMAPSVSMDVSVYPRALGDLQQASHRP